jgi:hypothetical protein
MAARGKIVGIGEYLDILIRKGDMSLHKVAQKSCWKAGVTSSFQATGQTLPVISYLSDVQ